LILTALCNNSAEKDCVDTLFQLDEKEEEDNNNNNTKLHFRARRKHPLGLVLNTSVETIGDIRAHKDAVNAILPLHSAPSSIMSAPLLH